MFATHNKKRPHNMVMGRMFNHKMLDMVELGVVGLTVTDEFKGVEPCGLGNKPCITFAGEEFETKAESVYGFLAHTSNHFRPLFLTFNSTG
jgi:ribosome production factor 2